MIGHLEQLLNDEHGLRHLSGIEEAGELRTLFATAHLLAVQLREIGKAEPVISSLVTAMWFRADHLEVVLSSAVLSATTDTAWSWSIPLPMRRPFKEARIRIDAEAGDQRSPGDLLDLIAEAFVVQRLVLASPELSLQQLAKREGRCRTQLARLLRLSWMSPRIVEAIAEGSQPKGLTRRGLLICDMPIEWAEQERQFGFAA